MIQPHDRSDKQVIAVVREYQALQQNRYKITELDQPYQRGWRRCHVLSERGRLHPDRPVLEAILEVIGSSVAHHSRDFRCRRGRSRALCEIEQPLKPIPHHEWQRKNFPEPWFRYFRYQILLDPGRHWQPFWVFSQPSLYRLKIKPNWIHHIRELDPAIESRLAELENWLVARQGWQRHGWLKGQPQSYRWQNGGKQKHRSLEIEHRREISHALSHFPELDPAASKRCIRIRLRPFFPIHHPGVAQRRGSELRPRPVRVQVLPPGPWNANRPSVPGLPAKETDLHRAGWGASPPRSANFHEPEA